MSLKITNKLLVIIDIHTHILEMGLQKQEKEIIDTDEPMKRNIVLRISTRSERERGSRLRGKNIFFRSIIA